MMTDFELNYGDEDRDGYGMTPESLKEIDNEIRCDEIVVEINTIRRQTVATMLAASVEIGRLLCEAKEKLLHGDFGGWLKENFEYSQSTANNLMKLYRNYGEPEQLDLFYSENRMEIFGKLSPSQALALLPLSEPDRREFVEKHDMENTSVREIEEAVRLQKEAEADRDEFLQRALAAEETAKYEKQVRESAEMRAAVAEGKLSESENALQDNQSLISEKAALESKLQKAVEGEKKAKEKLKDALKNPKVAPEELERLKKEAEDAARAAIAAEVEEKLRQRDKDHEQQTLEMEERLRKTEQKAKGSALLQRFDVHFTILQNEIGELRSIIEQIRYEDADTAEKMESAFKGFLEVAI